jgi:hypothetical protein
MEKNPLAKTHHVQALFTMILAVVNPFNRERVAEHLDGPVEGNPMVTLVRGRLGIIPFKHTVPHRMY